MHDILIYIYIKEVKHIEAANDTYFINFVTCVYYVLSWSSGTIQVSKYVYNII